MSAQQPIQLPPMITTGNVWFAPQAILAIDLSHYVPGKEDRLITLFLIGPHELELEAEDADSFKTWWDQVTGQARIQPPPQGWPLSAPHKGS